MEEPKPSPALPNMAIHAPSPPTSAPSKEEATVSRPPDGADEPVLRLHAKTFLAVLAMNIAYFATLVSLIGARRGKWPLLEPISLFKYVVLRRSHAGASASAIHGGTLPHALQVGLVPPVHQHSCRCPQPHGGPGRRLLGPQVVPRLAQPRRRRGLARRVPSFVSVVCLALYNPPPRCAQTSLTPVL